MNVTSPLPDRAACESKRSGFTFIEVLVSLAVLIILATTIMECHVRIIRAQETARTLEESRLLMARLACEAWIGTSSIPAAVEAPEGWNVDFDTFEVEEGTNRVAWNRWIVSPTNRPSLEAVLCLRAPPQRGKLKQSMQRGGINSWLRSLSTLGTAAGSRAP